MEPLYVLHLAARRREKSTWFRRQGDYTLVVAGTVVPRPAYKPGGALPMDMTLRRTGHPLILPLFFLSALSATGCDIVTADRRHQETAEWRKTYELQAGGRLEVSNTNGLIKVEPSAGKTVEIVAVKSARGQSPEDA